MLKYLAKTLLIHIPRSLVYNFIIVNFKVPIVWIHDYHLMLAANEIREMAEEEKLDCKIGFFLHIPFPPWDIFKIFPWVDSILQGILRLVKPFFHKKTLKIFLDEKLVFRDND